MSTSRIAAALLTTTVAFALTAGSALAADSGPKADSAVPALKVTAATGDDAGKEKDYAAERKDKPTVYVFVQAAAWDRPVARFLRTLDEELKKRDDGEAHMVVVWLTDDVEKAKEYLPKAQGSIKLERSTFTIHGDTKGPADWAINADITAVAASKGKVIASVGFVSVNETDAAAVVAKLPK